MNIEELRKFCLSVKASEECLPFDDYTLVMKVMKKMFAMIPLDSDELSITLKCDPEIALDLRDKYEAVEPGYHMNKKYWNTVYLNRDMKDSEVKKYILHSVDEVIRKLPKKLRDEYSEI